ncbi:MAG: PASTA domain-containing protein [Rikenellaceae bacterium]|nr:PASTA domain-containing protein [Rikenellaceae bacterium]
MPDFRGMEIGNVHRAARNALVRIDVTDSLYIPAYKAGIVLDQNPEPGTEVKAGRRILLTINASHRKMAEVPYVAGFSLRQAKNMLEIAGFEIEKLVYKPDMATNNVLEERYGDRKIEKTTGLQAETGSGVTLVVGTSGGARQAVPKVVGFGLGEAKSRIWEAGLNVGRVEYDAEISLLDQPNARVWMQSPDYPQRMVLGSTVDVKLTLDQAKIARGSNQADKRAGLVALTQDSLDVAGTDDGAAETAPSSELAKPLPRR